MNPTNAKLTNKSGIASEIQLKGGDEVKLGCKEYRKEHTELEEKKAAITPSGNLPCEVIIHVLKSEDPEIMIKTALSEFAKLGEGSLAIPFVEIDNLKVKHIVKAYANAIYDFIHKQKQKEKG